jgi:short-subunit dehydrogenase
MNDAFKKKYDSYALVTGASSGIGKALATELAGRGLNLVLVARNLDKLETLASILKQQFRVEVKCLSLDLSQDGAIDTLVRETAALQIGLLVLNAAVMHAGGFLKNSFEQESYLVRFNTLVTTQIAHRIGNRLKQQQRGGILFVSSLAGTGPAPYEATYAASKAYISSLGRALSFELAKNGVDVSVLIPGMTDTEGLHTTANIDYSKMKGVSMMSAIDVAKAGVDGLGKTIDIIPGGKNKFAAFLFGLLPATVVTKMVGKMTFDALDKNAQ